MNCIMNTLLLDLHALPILYIAIHALYCLAVHIIYCQAIYELYCQTIPPLYAIV